MTPSPEPSRALSPLLARFEAHLAGERRVSEHTQRAYGRDLAQLQAFLRENSPEREPTLKDVGRLQLRLWLARIAERSQSATVGRKLAAARTFFRFLQREGVVAENPAADLATPKLRSRLPRVPNADRTRDLMEAPDAQPGLAPAVAARDRLALELLYGAGLRVSELGALELDALDVAAGTARVFGKGRKERLVPLGSKAIEALLAYLALRPALKHPRTGAQDARALLLSQRGARLSVRAVQLLVGRYGALALGTSELHPHTLRHACATHMLDGGADLRVIQELLGHKTLSTTQRYTQVSLAQLVRVYDAAHPLAGRPRREPDERAEPLREEPLQPAALGRVTLGR